MGYSYTFNANDILDFIKKHKKEIAAGVICVGCFALGCKVGSIKANREARKMLADIIRRNDVLFF